MSPRPRTHSSVASVRGWLGSAAVGAMVLCAGSAWGQNALGDGTGLTSPLDRDLGRNVPRGRVNTAASFQRDLTMRNAIVTGNAPGGLSFRGDVGYAAPEDFRGQLGSNDLFAFRRDSLYSGFAGLGIRGTESLQFQFALTTGNARGILGAGPVPRFGGGIGTQGPSTLADPRVSAEVSTLRDPNPPGARTADRTDQGGSMMGMLRSPAAYTVNRGIQPEIMSALADPRTGLNWALTASSLRGVRMSRLLDAQQELARPGASESTAMPTTAVPSGQPETASPVTGQTRVTGLAVPESYQGMMERFRAAAEGRAPAPADETAPTPVAPAPGLQPAPTEVPQTPPDQTPATPTDWESRLQEIRERLSRDISPDLGQTSLTPPTGTVPGTGPEEDEPNLTETAAAGAGQFRPLDPEVLRIIRETGARIERYADPGVVGDPYSQHMSVAGELMRAGAYFDAEERFARAQAARSDDYLAAVGRVHAQLGAGMYLSAGMNLRRLLSDHPEVAAARFDASMLPVPARLDTLVLELRANVDKALAGQSVLLGTDSALLLSYVGFQRGNSGLLREGLATYQRLLELTEADRPTEGQTARVHGSALLELITSVWGEAPLEAP